MSTCDLGVILTPLKKQIKTFKKIDIMNEKKMNRQKLQFIKIQYDIIFLLSFGK